MPISNITNTTIPPKNKTSSGRSLIAEFLTCIHLILTIDHLDGSTAFDPELHSPGRKSDLNFLDNRMREKDCLRPGYRIKKGNKIIYPTHGEYQPIMSWQVMPRISEILKKGGDFQGIDRASALELMHLELHSRETYALMETANRMTREQFGDKGENHLHIGVNIEPCPFNCSFCSLTESAHIFREKVEFPPEKIIGWAKTGEQEGADALNIMTTGTYPFRKLLDLGRHLTAAVSIPLVANTRDVTHKEGEQLLDAGFVGAYHAVRLGEGKDTPFVKKKRVRTITILKDVGLRWMNCVEPVGPEHKAEEIVDLMFLAREYRATYSGIMRRINFRGSPMEPFGMITELEMARMLAVSRLVMGDVPAAHCSHEPHEISLLAGGNLFFPEVGSNPRDGVEQMDAGRGKSILETKQIHREMGMDPLLPSNCFSDRQDRQQPSSHAHPA